MSLSVPPTPTETFNVSAGGINTTGHFLYSDGNTTSDSNTQGISSFYSNTTIGVAGPDHIELSNGKNIAPPLYYQGDMAEILVFNFAMDSTQVAAVANYLSNKWLGTTPVASVTNLLPATTPLVLNAGGALDLSAANQTLASLADGPQGGGTITNSGQTDATLTISGTSSTTFSGSIQNGPTNQIFLVQSGSGTLTLSGGSSTYTGSTSILGGELTVRQLVNGGQASSIGAASNSSSQLVLDGGALRYTGSGSTTDRLFTIGALTNSATLDASGSGPLVFSNTGAIALAGSSSLPPVTPTLTLIGTSTAANTFMPQLADPPNGLLFVVKDGPGTWVFNSPQNFHGALNVNGGRLVLGPRGSIDETNIEVAGGATFAVQTGGGTVSTTQNINDGSAGTVLTMDAGSVFDMTDGTVGRFNLLQESGFNNYGLILQGATLKFDLAAARADLLAVSDTVEALATNFISITGIGTALTPGNYTLITAQGGLDTSSLALATTAVTVGATTYGLTLSHSTPTSEILTVTGSLAVSSGTWAAAGGGSWTSAANWTSGHMPAGGTVLFTDNTAANSVVVTLDAAQAAANITFGNLGATGGFALEPGDNGSLTLAGSGGTATVKIVRGTDAIDTPVTLLANLLVTPSAGSTLDIAGDIDQSGGSRSLALSGSGELILSGDNTFSGGVDVRTGLLDITSAGSLPNDSSLVIGAGGAFDFNPEVASGPVTSAGTVAVVPEPSTLALSIAGLLAIAFATAQKARRRRRDSCRPEQAPGAGQAGRFRQQTWPLACLRVWYFFLPP